MIATNVVERALKQFKLSHKGIHGIDHWNAVHKNGNEICDNGNADRVVVDHFAVLHDMCRTHEGHDMHHGPAAAYLIEDMELDLSDAQRMILVYAVRHHSDGMTTKSPTIGACWDADRLDLVRLGITLDLSMMNTPHGIVMAERANRKMIEDRERRQEAVCNA